MRTSKSLAISVASLLIPVAAAAAEVEPMLVTPRAMRPVATIDERFLSYNVEMAEVIGGNFWKPYTAESIAGLKANAAAPLSRSGGASPGVAGQDPTMLQARSPIDLSNVPLRKLAAALAPAYIRNSGTWANSVYMTDPDVHPPPPNGFQGALTRSAWKGVVDFSQAVGAKIVSSFVGRHGARQAASAVVGSIIDRTRATLLAGKPPF
jgi:heparanase 1